MSLQELSEKISGKTATIAVIGLGYVGLPLAACLADVGFMVLGVDRKQERVAVINQGKNPIGGKEPGLDELLKKTVSARYLRATTDYQQLRDCDVVFINVETPVEEDHKPSYQALRSVLKALGPVLKKGALVIVESTISPGTMKNIVLPDLEKSADGKLGHDFYLGNCPERVMPGRLLANIHSMQRAIGGADEQTAQTMALIYKQFVNADLDLTDWVTAELVKTVENAYRDVQIAFANEIAILCADLGADVWKVRELVNKTPYRNVHKPGAGVGGHCIPKDPWLLASSLSESKELSLIPAARAINDSMPEHVFTLLEKGLSTLGKMLKDSRILILGYAYLENSDDDRNSPSELFARRLMDGGCSFSIHDPFIERYQGDIYHMAKDCDALVLMTAHDQYRDLDLKIMRQVMRTPLIIDGRNAFADLTDLHGFEIICLGKG
jgi:UDP-N-acetyl-D-mannosaminuronic acid dehydrogenase